MKLPRLNSLACHLPETLDLAFKLRRKKFSIEVGISTCTHNFLAGHKFESHSNSLYNCLLVKHFSFRYSRNFTCHQSYQILQAALRKTVCPANTPVGKSQEWVVLKQNRAQNPQEKKQHFSNTILTSSHDCILSVVFHAYMCHSINFTLATDPLNTVV